MKRLEDTALSLDILDDLQVELAAVGVADGAGKGLVGNPLGRGTRGGLLHHAVDLLEGKTLGLGNQEPRVHEGAGTETSPDEEDRRSEVAFVRVNHVGSDDSNDGVPQPVGGGRESDTTRSDGKREDFTDQNPGTRAPSGSEEEDEDGNEGDLSVDSGDVVGAGKIVTTGGVGDLVSVVETDGNTDNSDDKLADQHAEGTPDEERTATELLNSVEGDGGRADVDKGEDQRDQEGVADGTGGLEERSRVVEDEVDTSPLLHHLQRGTKDGLAQVAALLPERTLEAVGPTRNPASGGDHGTLVLLVGDDLRELSLDVVRVAGLATESGQCVTGSLDVTTLDEVTRRVGKEEETTTENNTEDELDADGNAVRASVVDVLGTIVNACSQQETDSDAELVTGNESTSDLARANLRHVQDDNGRFETDTETGDETTSNDQTETVRGDLENDTDNVDSATNDDSPATTDGVGDITSDNSTEEGTGREDRSNERVVRTGESIVASALDELDEDRRTGDTVDVTRVVTEEDTTEGGKGADQIGLPGDWSLNLIDIRGGSKHSTRHVGGCL